MTAEINNYNNQLPVLENTICNFLAEIIEAVIQEAESKIWHGHPVWFSNENPVVGYSRQKNGIQLLFWSGQTFEEEKLQSSGKFKAAEIIYSSLEEINPDDLSRWLKKSMEIQWDYKNIVKRKGRLERLK